MGEFEDARKRAKDHDPFAPPPEELEVDRGEVNVGLDQFAPDAEARTAERDRGRLGPADPFAPPELDALPELEVETYDKKRPRNPEVERMEREPPPRAGCTCRKRYDLYLDNDLGAMAAWLGSGFGIIMLILAFWLGPYGALSVGLFGATCGGMATIISISLRCEGCRKRVTDLTADEHVWVTRGRREVIKWTVILGVFTLSALFMFLFRFI